MKKLFLFALMAMVFAACSQQPKTEETPKEVTFTVDSLLLNMDSLVGKEVVVIGKVDHVCKHGGGKMVIYTIDPENGLHVEATETSGNFVADEVMGELVRVVGTVEEFRVDDGYIAEKEAELAEKKANEPKAEAKKTEDHKGEFPDGDNKHKLQVEALQNQIASLKGQIAEAKANGKAYISFFSVKCNSYEVLTHNNAGKSDSTAVEGHVESAVENEAAGH